MNNLVRALICLLALGSTASLAQDHISGPAITRAKASAKPGASQAAALYGKLPLSFEPNQGQADQSVRFLSRGPGYSLYLTSTAAVLALSKPAPSADLHSTGDLKTPGTDVIRMQFVGASPKARVEGADPLSGKVNYLIGNDQAKWHTGVPTYGQVKYTGVYPGIDLVYYGNQSQLEYDLDVAPGVDPRRVQLSFEGKSKLTLSYSGDLTVATANGEIFFHKPLVYQMKDGQRQSVDSQFILLSKNTVGFSLGAYDRSRGLVIDPVLAYSTYFDQATPQFVAVDGAGYAYVSGYVAAGADFPLSQTPVQPVNPAGSYYDTSFVTKFNPAGSALVYSTFLGGSGGDNPVAMAVDQVGNVYVTGTTCSNDFPRTVNALPVDLSIICTNFDNGSPAGLAGYITKLNSGGSSFGYSNVLNALQINAIAVDSLGSAYVTGYLDTPSLPVTDGVLQPTFKGGQDEVPNAFVLKLDPTGSAIDYATYLGGSGYISYDDCPSCPGPPIVEGVYGDEAFGIAVDSSGDAYVAGKTYSTDFPVTPHAFQTSLSGNPNPYIGTAGAANAFVSKLDPNGASLLYSTYIGGNQYAGPDGATAVAIDNSGSAYVTGGTGSSNFPTTAGAFETTNTYGLSNFVTKLSPDGSSLAYSTYFNSGNFYAIAIDSTGDAFVAGQGDTRFFPLTTGALEPGTSTQEYFEPVLSELNPAGTALLYSTFLGICRMQASLPLSCSGVSPGLALDSLGNPYLAGQVTASRVPTTPGTYQDTSTALTRNFIMKLSINGATTTTLDSNANPQASSTPVQFTATVTSNSESGTPAGLVNFLIDGVPQSKVALDGGGQAQYQTSLPVGPHAVTASYYGDETNYSSSNGTLTQTITGKVATPTFVTLGGTYTDSHNMFAVQIATATLGAAIHYTIDNTMPSGTSPLYTGPIPVSTTTTVRAIATETGDTTSDVAAAVFTIVPNAILTGTTLTASANPAAEDEPVTFTATVTPASGSTPTGSVVFKNGPSVMATVPLTAGVATYTAPDFGAGSHAITATYTGSATNSLSGQTLNLTVNP